MHMQKGSYSQKGSLWLGSIPVVPSTAAAFPLWTAMESLCRRYSLLYEVLLWSGKGAAQALWWSPVQLGPVRLKSQLRKAQSVGWIWGGVYLLRFRCSAFKATAPASVAASDRCEGTYVSGHIASHSSIFPDKCEETFVARHRHVRSNGSH